MNNKSTAIKILAAMDGDNRRKKIIRSIILLLIVFYLHSLANGWDSPLALLPRTFTGTILGGILFYISSLAKFPAIIEYLDKDKLVRDAQPGAAPDANNGRG